MSIKPCRRHGLTLPAASLAFLISASTSMLAQQSAKPVTEKWRPKDGLYVIPDEYAPAKCEGGADYRLDLRNKLVIRNEAYNCNVTKLAYPVRDTLRLDLSCDEYRPEDDIKEPDANRRFKETMTLRKIDEKSLVIRMTGEFRGELKVDYCPDPQKPTERPKITKKTHHWENK